MGKGIVLKSTGSHYKVLNDEGNVLDCTVKGKLRTQEIKTTNPVAVGDKVLIKRSGDNSNSSVIIDILDRNNYILRKASNLSKQSQIIAANVDQIFLMVTVVLPETQIEFIDRFLISAEAYRIPTILIINKTDIYSSDELVKVKTIEEIYENIGYRCLSVSLKNNEYIEEVKSLMINKITLVSGNSGVGKTTLLNILNPSLGLKTGEISSYHKQGKHITTYTEMHPMPFGGFAIDTPGIKGFGVVDMERNEIYHFFPEIFRISQQCRFNNCLHLDEPDCAVRLAVENGEININRYRSYLSIMDWNDRKYR